MKFEHILWLGWNFFKRQPLRTWLTIIGIVLGASAIITVLAIGQGFVKNIEDQFSAFGNDRLTIIPVSKENSMNPGAVISMNNFILTDKDISDIAHITGVKSVSGMVWNRATVCFKEECMETMVSGIAREGIEMWDTYLSLEKGRMLKTNAYEANLGYDAANNIFSKKIRVGDEIKVNNKTIKVVGIFEKMGTSISQTDDKAFVVSLKAARDIFKDVVRKDEINTIIVQIDPSNQNKVIEEIKRVIKRNHHVSEDDFTVITAKYIQEVVGRILGTAYGFVTLITIIAGIVGGLGVANTTYMSVIEKRKEIATMKALGAKRRDILKIFLVESTLLTTIGSIIGGVMGILFTVFVSKFGVPYSISIWMVLFILIYSVVTGLISGIIPAMNASKLDVIEGLRD